MNKIILLLFIMMLLLIFVIDENPADNSENVITEWSAYIDSPIALDDMIPLDDGWLYRKQITLNHFQVPSTLTNFPVLINITDTDLRDRAQADGDDICFFNSTCTKLNHEIELYNSTTGQLIAWVNVTSLSSSADTVIYMYYGNATCGSQQNAEGTWDGNYVMVQHMNDATTSTIKDSTSNNNDGTKKGANEPIQVDGVIGKGQQFDGTNDYISVANHASLNFGANTDYTISAWTIYTDDNDVNPIVNKRKTDPGPYIGYRMLIMNFNNVVRYSLNANNYDITCDWKTDANNYYVYTADRDGSIKLFDDGVNKNTQACPAENVDNTLNLFIGALRVDGSNFPFNGILDEVRISNLARSADWILTEYNNMINATDGGFFTMASSAFLTIVDRSSGDTAISDSLNVNLSNNDTGTHTHMRFSNDNISWSSWMPITEWYGWVLAEGGDGIRTVYAEYTDMLILNRSSDTIYYDSDCSLSITTNYGDIIPIEYFKYFTFNYSITNMNLNYDYSFMIYGGLINDTNSTNSITSYMNNDTVDLSGVTQNGSVTLDLSDYIAHKGTYQGLGFAVWGVNDTGSVLDADYYVLFFNVSFIPPSASVMYLSIRNVDPYHLDMKALQVVNRGITMDASSVYVSDTSTPDSMTYHLNPLQLHCFVCNRTSNKIVRYGSMQLLFEHTDEYTIISSGYMLSHSLDWSELIWGKDLFNPRENYTVYWGVKCDDYSDTDFVLTYDETVQAVNFSIENMLPYYGDSLSSYATYADKFIGFMTYFETFQGAGDKYPLGFTGGYQNTNYGQIIRDYFDDMGMGWFSTILAYLIPIIFVGLVYYFMREHEISLPSYLYGLPIIAGLYLSFAVGIMVLWMFLFSVLGVVFSFMYHYREPINKALEVVKGKDIISGKSHLKIKSVAEKPHRYPFKQSRLPIKIDQGIAPQRISRKSKILTMQTSLKRPPLESELPAYEVEGLRFTPKRGSIYYKKKIKNKGDV